MDLYYIKQSEVIIYCVICPIKISLTVHLVGFSYTTLQKKRKSIELLICILIKLG